MSPIAPISGSHDYVLGMRRSQRHHGRLQPRRTEHRRRALLRPQDARPPAGVAVLIRSGCPDGIGHADLLGDGAVSDPLLGCIEVSDELFIGQAFVERFRRRDVPFVRGELVGAGDDIPAIALDAAARPASAKGFWTLLIPATAARASCGLTVSSSSSFGGRTCVSS
jgi:hypothetical protein